jgi:transcriptional regulator with XRE-family HTH domain
MARPRNVQRRGRGAPQGGAASAHARVAAEIRRARQAAGLTQRELAARLKKTPSWIAAAENGRRLILVRDLPRIAAALGMDVLELLRRAMRGPS